MALSKNEQSQVGNCKKETGALSMMFQVDFMVQGEAVSLPSRTLARHTDSGSIHYTTVQVDGALHAACGVDQQFPPDRGEY
jgi:hypothetical protein